ncbi:MAG TPA: hypothetical protein VFF80_06235 [Bacillota bacterium]|nr:hypothetical protein [Bacillota bacterium]
MAAVGVATTIADTNMISYTLTAGTFDPTSGIMAGNWTLGGLATPELGNVLNIIISNSNQTATLSISGTVWARTVDYTVAPTQAAFTVGFAAPSAAAITVFDA